MERRITFFAIVILASLAAILAIRLTNPGLTETELFLQFWPHFLFLTAFNLGAFLVLTRVKT